MNGVARGIAAACLLALTACAVRTDAQPVSPTSVTIESPTSVSFAPAEYQSHYTVYQPGFIDKAVSLTGSQWWSVNVEKARDLRVIGQPIQVGQTVVLNVSDGHDNAGVIALDAQHGDVLWQDRALNCTSVDVGGSLICSKNGGGFAPYDMDNGTVGAVINPGFEPAGFLYYNEVLYTVGSSGTGAILLAAGTPDNPASLWTTTIARPAELIDGQGLQSQLSVTNGNLVATVGSAEAVVDATTGALKSIGAKQSTDGLITPGLIEQGSTNATRITATALVIGSDAGETKPLVQPANTTSLHGSVVLSGYTIVYGAHDTLSAYDPQGNHLWDLPTRLSDSHMATDGQYLWVNGASEIEKIDLGVGQVVDTLPGGSGTSLYAARDGIMVLSNNSGTVSYYS